MREYEVLRNRCVDSFTSHWRSPIRLLVNGPGRCKFVVLTFIVYSLLRCEFQWTAMQTVVFHPGNDTRCFAW